MEEGGHIGYVIRPSERRKGYGTLILGLALVQAHACGLDRVRFTCNTENIASARIIEKKWRNPGQLRGINLVWEADFLILD